MNRARPFVLALVLVLVGAVGTSSSGATPAAKTKTGGTLTFATGVSPPRFAPNIVNNVTMINSSSAMNTVLYGALVYFDNKANVVKPDMAESLTGDATGLNWTLKLRPNIKFTDGTAYDAAAVLANWEWAKGPFGSKVTNQTVAGTLSVYVDSYSAVDNLTVKMVLKVANPTFDQIFAANLPYVGSPTALNKYNDDYGTSPETTVGAGPFTLTKYVRDSVTELTKNPNYWKKGFPKLDKLIVLFSPDVDTRFVMVQTGQADYTYNVGAPEWMARAKSAGLDVVEIVPDSVQVFAVNPQRSPTNLPEVRRAMQIALDPKSFVQLFDQGRGTVATTLFAKGSAWNTASAKLPKYDKVEAQKLFDQAAAKLGGPVKIDFLVSQSTPQYAGFLTALYQGYKNLEVNVLVRPAANFGTLWREGDWNFTNTGRPVGPDPLVFLSDYLKTNNSRGLGRANDTALDQLITDGMTTGKKDERVKIWNDAAERIVDNNWILFRPAFEPLRQVVLGPRVKGYDDHKFENNIEELSVASKG